MIRSFPSLLLAAALLSGAIPALQAQVIVEAPEEGSGLKWFEFAGGTPAQLMEELKKTFGPFPHATMMEDLTKGDPLPAAKLFSTTAHLFLVTAYPKRIEVGGDKSFTNYIFYPGKAPDPFAAGGAAGAAADPFAAGGPDTPAAPAPPVPVLCQFPGGTPRDLVKFLERTFSCRMEEVTTIAPEMEKVRLPALNMRVSDVENFLDMLNKFSNSSAGAWGSWEIYRIGHYETGAGTGLSALMISPRYDEQNPPPAILARDTAAGPAARAVRALEARIKSMNSTLQQTRQALETLEKQVKELPAKVQ